MIRHITSFTLPLFLLKYLYKTRKFTSHGVLLFNEACGHELNSVFCSCVCDITFFSIIQMIFFRFFFSEYVLILCTVYMYIIKHHHRRYALHIMNKKFNSDGKQFQQYHQNKQSPLISNNQIITRYHHHICRWISRSWLEIGGVKHVSEISSLPLDN